MKMNAYVLSLFVVVAVLLAGCNKPLEISGAHQEGMEKQTMEQESMEMAEEGFEMMGGKMMMVDAKTKTQSVMDKDAVLHDGTKVMMNGKVMKKDGSMFTLKEGESMWMDGSFMKAGEMMGDMMEDEHSMGKGSGMMDSEFTGKVLAGTTSPYLEFNHADYEQALQDKEVIVLYFYANWCPLCKQEQSEVFGAFDQLDDSSVIGFRVNYKDDDTDADEEALAKEFGIAYQHTKVILKNGEKVLKAPDSWDKQRYLTELAKV